MIHGLGTVDASVVDIDSQHPVRRDHYGDKDRHVIGVDHRYSSLGGVRALRQERFPQARPPRPLSGAKTGSEVSY